MKSIGAFVGRRRRLEGQMSVGEELGSSVGGLAAGCLYQRGMTDAAR